MQIKDFYDFSSKFSMSTFSASPGLIEKSPLITGNYENFQFPLLFQQESGKKMHDVLDTGYVSLYLISDRMRHILEKNGLTGWQTYQVKILDKKGEEVQGYHGFSVLGRCGSVDYTKGEIIEKRLVPTGPLSKYYRGLYIGLDEWDGSDFFIAEGTIGITITKKAGDVIKKNKLTNIALENLSNIEIAESSLKILYPEKFGRLSKD